MTNPDDMEDKRETLQSLLLSKAKMMADRNKRFAIIDKEVAELKKLLNSKLDDVKEKIITSIEDDEVTNE